MICKYRGLRYIGRYNLDIGALLLILISVLSLSPLLLSCTEEDLTGLNEPGAYPGVLCEFSSPEEWIVADGEAPEFTYRLSAERDNGEELELEVCGFIPGEETFSWRISGMISLPEVGETVTGRLRAPHPPDPGFYICKVTLGGTLIRVFNIVCGAESYSVPNDRPADFGAFWKNALDDLSKVPINAKMELNHTLSSKLYNVYEVLLNSAGDFTGDVVEIRGRYVAPVGGENMSLQIMFIGYDDPDSGVWDPISSGGRDKAILVVYSRGQGLNSRFGRKNRYGEWVVNHLESPDDYYYRGAYLDAVRTVEFAHTLPGVDRNKIYANGGSQGGALAVAAAALTTDKLKFIIVAFPFMGNFSLYLKTAVWPTDKIERMCRLKGLPIAEALRTLSYFDTKNLAGWVRCPVLLQMTLQDKTCPPWTQFPVLTNLPVETEREWSIYPEADHNGLPGMSVEENEFISRHM